MTVGITYINKISKWILEYKAQRVGQEGAVNGTRRRSQWGLNVQLVGKIKRNE